MSIQREIPREQATASAASVEQASPRRSFLSIGTPGGLSRAATSEALEQASVAIEKAIKLQKPSSSLILEMVKIDNTRVTKLHLSSIVFVSRPADTSLRELSFHTLLIEGSGEPLAPAQLQIGTQQLPVTRYTEEVLNEFYLETISDLLAEAYPGYAQHNASACVVPRNFNWEDVDAVRSLVNNASWAVVNKVVTRLNPDETRINLAEFGQDAFLQLNPSFRQADSQDHLGRPVRSDCMMTLTAVPTRNDRRDALQGGERPINLANIFGFTDLVWAPTQTNYGFAAQGPNFKFAARQVLTCLENTRYNTVEAQLLALAAAYRLNENNTWYMGFLPSTAQYKKGAINLKDIGALNIEANVYNEPSGFGGVIDTSSATWTPLELGKFLNQAVRPGLSISVDVSRCGPDTWFNEIFSAASLGDVDAQRAILEAANNLTGGHFGTFYKNNEPPFVVLEETVLMGTYRKADGTLGDLRDFDHLAVLNLVGTNDPTIGAQWSDTFTRLDQPNEKRVQARASLLSNLESTVTITGTAQRSTVSSGFMKALVDSIAATGQQMRLGSHSDVQFQNNRGVASWVDQAHLAPSASGLFRTGSQPRADLGIGQRFTGRSW